MPETMMQQRLLESRDSLVRQRTAAFALAALLLFPLGILMPVVAMERFGFRQETSIIGGTSELLASGHVVLAIIVLVCSILIPVCKLTGLLVLSSRHLPIGSRGRDLVWRFLEVTGRWGMLDVLLVAALVAAVKLGDLVSIESGPGLYAFAGTVVLSLLASASWDPALVGGRRS
ncbi:MAG: paraquat-inducible protein A [Phycisphaerales bacterium]|nr:paraquat-inducible protein A [Phycisphaerales bacterium]